MKLVTAVVRPCCLEDVRTAVARMGLDGMTMTEAICSLARSGRDGDGRVLVCALTEAIRIRTGETAPPPSDGHRPTTRGSLVRDRLTAGGDK